jgi:hypothetical protein
MCTGVPFQVKGVVEALAAKSAQVAFGIAVALHVAVEEPLKCEHLRTKSALKFGRIRLWSGSWQFSSTWFLNGIGREGILNSMSAIDQFNLGVLGDSELKK